MDEKELNEKLQEFWNESGKGVDPIVITKEDVDTKDVFSHHMIEIGNNYERVLDIGCGFGESLFDVMLKGEKTKYALGVDTSKNAIEFASKTTSLSKIDNLEFKVCEEDTLNSIEDHSFDAIICSNTLDVVSPSMSIELINNIKRIVKDNGLVFIKVNFYLTEDIIERTKAIALGDDCYSINGVLRSRNKTDEYWINIFKPFSLVNQDLYERIPNGPKDRIFIFKK